MSKKLQLEWHTEQRKINELIPFEGNPRKMSKEQAEQLQKSLEKFNLAEIPAINTDNKIIAGHQRINILQMLGRGEEIIDVRVPNRELTDDEFKEYNLRSNKNIGSWDFDELANFDDDLLKDVGFTREELIEYFGINNIEDVVIGEDRIEVITVMPPESPRLKEKQIFYCNSIDEYEKIEEYFKTDKNGYLDKKKLLEFINGN